MGIPEGYQKALAIAPKFTALASIMGSSMIISSVIRSNKNRHLVQQRIVLSMSVIDVIVSTTWFFSPLFVPNWSQDMYWATGNQMSCSTQGFIVQFSISSVFYNAALALYYLLVIQYGWTEERFRHIEPLIHIVPISWGLVTAIIALCLKLYNPANWDCWIAPLPPDCTQSFQLDSNDNGDIIKPCVRGDNASIFQWAFFFAPLWTAILFVTGSMISVYRDVRRKELDLLRSREENISLKLRRERSQSYDSDPASIGTTNVNNSLSDNILPSMSINSKIDYGQCLRYTREVFSQSLMYVGAFYCTWFFPTLTRIIQLFQSRSGGGQTPSWIILLSGIFIPIQGLLNAVVYFRPRLKVYRQSDPGITLWRLLKKMINTTLCCCLTRKNQVDTDAVEQPRDYSFYVSSRFYDSVFNENSDISNEGIATAIRTPVHSVPEEPDTVVQREFDA